MPGPFDPFQPLRTVAACNAYLMDAALEYWTAASFPALYLARFM